MLCYVVLCYVDPNLLCHGSVLRHQERIQCTVPVLAWNQAETQSSSRVGGGLGKGAGSHGIGHKGRGGGGGAPVVVGAGGVLLDGEEEEGGREGAEEEGASTGGGGGEGLSTTVSVSLSVGDRGAVWKDGVEYALRGCNSAEDCDDGDACSFDACVKVGLFCFCRWCRCCCCLLCMRA